MGAIVGGFAGVLAYAAVAEITYTADYYFSGGTIDCRCDYSQPSSYMILGF
jgi:hypothetical protein